MWYEKAYRRHLCDMHIDDWSEEFLSRFSPEDYLDNLKRAKIQNAMLYFQSHVGLCYFPTNTAKTHRTFRNGDRMKRLVTLCHENGISVTGYYSLIYNNTAHDMHPEWRMIQPNGKSLRQEALDRDTESRFRYGLCCPNNRDYRSFVAEQLKEMAAYFDGDALPDGMFFDMPFWPHMCMCEDCKRRFREETRHELPTEKNYADPVCILQLRRRREWMGEFCAFVKEKCAECFPKASVEFNFAFGALPNPEACMDERVNECCDYAGGDLYGDIYSQSFTCKFYQSITKHPPFEYMFSRCEPGLRMHTTLKSRDRIRSAVYLTAAHHGATLVIDAIDPVGTQDKRVYDEMGSVFAETSPYEAFYAGKPLSDVGIYYSLKSKYSPDGDKYINHTGCVNTVKTLVKEHILCGITGSFDELSKYKLVIAPLLSDEDDFDCGRLIEYVKNGGTLYFSGVRNRILIEELLVARVEGMTENRTVYIAPKPGTFFGRFTEDYPMCFEAAAPVLSGVNDEDVIARIKLPYTGSDEVRFASIHSNPPGIATDVPALVVKDHGKGRVLWSALPIECETTGSGRKAFVDLLNGVGMERTVETNAASDVELTVFRDENDLYVNAVLLNEEEEARTLADFSVGVRAEAVSAELLPSGEKLKFTSENGKTVFTLKKPGMFTMVHLKTR